MFDYQKVRPRPCSCGCGEIARGVYKRGHGPFKRYKTRDCAREHRGRAEAALGRPLPRGAIVHHADGTKNDMAPLVICQDEAYHKLLHVRMAIVRAGGDPDTQRLCYRCGRVVTIHEMADKKAREQVVSGRCRRCKDDEVWQGAFGRSVGGVGLL